tara:strand:+ start:155 stop:595 length:441 start_codon:yes stop_codon:yes gene_type:complete
MIEKINNTNILISYKIHNLFQLSYKKEADILKVKKFPPLSRGVDDILNSKNYFFAYFLKDDFLGIIELDDSKNIHIQSLVVHPDFFRKGIASQLIDFVIIKHKKRTFTVETALGNYPAIKLYKSYGFRELNTYDAEFNIRKIRLIL